MTTDSNIYDIDGEILRKVGDNEELSIDEAQKRVTSYQEKLKNLDPKDPKVSIYNTYIRNLQSYIFNQYLLHPELMPHMQNTTQDEIKKAMEELKAEVENEENNEEYVDFEEVKEDVNE